MKKLSVLTTLAVAVLSCLLSGCGSSKTSGNESSNPGGGTSPAPLSVTGISPASILAGPAANLTVSGTGFTTTSVVQLNGVALQTTYVSATHLTAIVPAGQTFPAGRLNVTVTDKGVTAGGASTALEIDNPKPTITSLTPGSVFVGSGPTNVTVAGSNFLTNTVVQINGAARPTTYTSDSQLAVNLDASDLVSTGSLSITTVSPAPGGGESNSVGFGILNPAPVLSSASPTSISRSSTSTVVTLQGSGFQPTSMVSFNGKPFATAFLDTTRLSVTIAQSDLPSTGSGTFQVTTPAPGGGTSATLPIAISGTIRPVITSIQTNVSGANSSCERITLDITGTNLAVPGPVIKFNGTAIPPISTVLTNTYARVSLPSGIVGGTNPTLTIESTYVPDFKSAPYTISDSATAICITPAAPVVYPGTLFALDTSFTSLNSAVIPAVSALGLPSGFSANTPGPYNSPARIALRVASSVAAGNYVLSPQVTGAPALTGTIPVTVGTTKPTLFFVQSYTTEIAVPIGGSASFNVQTLKNDTNDAIVNLAVQGLPSGVSAKIQPAQSLTGESATITLTADTTATPHQNLPITVTGAINGTDVSASQSYSLNVTNGPGTIPNNRTAFTSTQGTPSSVVFDRAHNLVFASNSQWNRIDVISNLTHKIEKSIPIASPTAIDLSQDAQTLWVGTKSQQVFALNTSTFTLRKYTLPDIPAYFWATGQLFALSNGDLLIVATGSSSSSIVQTFVWSPASGATNKVVMDYTALRSGDGTKVFGLSTAFNGCSLQVYSVAQGTVQSYPINSGSTGSSYCGTLHASNRNGSMLVGNIGGGIQLLDGTGQPLGSFTPALTPGTLVTREQVLFNASAFHFSDDGTLLYQTGSLSNYTNLLATYDVATRALLGLAPAITSPVPPLSGGYGGPTMLVDVDPTGMLIGIQNFGVAFEDATYFQNLGTSSVRLSGGTPTSFAPQSGPLAGGTEFGVNAYNTTLPDVWFGDIRGTASISAGSMRLTSPAGAAPGPVDLKVIYPNGLQGYVAQGFSYGPFVQNMVYNGSAPTGGAPATLTGFGLPVDSSGGSVTVGGSAATITSVVEQYPPWTGESVPSTYLKFTLPAGTPGFADLQVQTPNGSSTLSRAVFYASSVNSYAFTGTPSAVVYDKKRNRAYVLIKTQVLVFDAGSGAFLSPINVPTANGVFDLRDAALSIDTNYLVVSNSGDGSVAVLDLESPGSSYPLALPDLVSRNGNCSAGPSTVVAVAGGKALVLPETSNPDCGSPRYDALINITGHSSSSIPLGITVGSYALYRAQAQSNGDGTLVLIKFGDGSSSCYSPAGGFGVIPCPIGGYSESISADGNLLTADLRFFDASGRTLGIVAQPQALYGYSLTPEYPPASATIMLRGARLNAAGSLYFVPHTGYFEIIDALTATLRMRFSLSETVQDVTRPIATDEGGKQIFFLTSAGLTVVNMGQAPLSVGHLGATQPVSGGVIQLRGSGFDSNTTVMIDTSPANASFVDENTMNITLPSLPSGPHDLILQRTDGSSITARGLIFIP